MIEASLRIHLPCSWVTLVTQDFGAAVNIVEQKPLGGGLLRSLVEIESGDAEPASIVEALRNSPDIVKVEAIVPPKGRILATLQVRDCNACQSLANSECFLTEAQAEGKGGLVWHVMTDRRPAVEELVKELKEKRIDVELLSIHTAEARGMLTDRQQEVISLAYNLGYFEFPKKINLTHLAKKLGIAKSTLSEILRTGEAKVLHAYFHGVMKKGQ